jgi:hypothetical protein
MRTSPQPAILSTPWSLAARSRKRLVSFEQRREKRESACGVCAYVRMFVRVSCLLWHLPMCCRHARQPRQLANKQVSLHRGPIEHQHTPSLSTPTHTSLVTHPLTSVYGSAPAKACACATIGGSAQRMHAALAKVCYSCTAKKQQATNPKMPGEDRFRLVDWLVLFYPNLLLL